MAMADGAAVQALMTLRGVTKTFPLPDGTDLTVFQDLDLTVRPGELVAVLGPSGSGKSTLLRLMAGLIEPTAGDIYYREKPLRGINPGVAMVFQAFALFPWLTVQENVELGLEPLGLDAAARRAKALRAIDTVGLDGFETAFPRELSGGMQQRVGVARALVVEPDVLLMDEPFSALDVLTAENLRRDILALWTGRLMPTETIVMVTHSIEEAVFMADRILVLSRTPARVTADIAVDMPHWRSRDAEEFKSMVDHLYAILTEPRPAPPPSRRREGEEVPAAAAPAGPPVKGDHGAAPPPREEAEEAPIPAEGIPPVRADALTGFVELLLDSGGAIDIYEFGEQFQLAIQDFIHILEAAHRLGLCHIDEGDMQLTSVGRRFAEATLLERKNIFRRQARRRVPALQQVLKVLRAKKNGKAPREFFLALLEPGLGRDEADRRLDTIIDWGRYAELIAYDEESETISLDPGEAARTPDR